MPILERSRALTSLFLLVTIVATGACRPDAHHAPTAADDAGPPQRAVARLGERYLVHLIAPPLVRNEPVAMLLHGTRLDSGAPLSGGEIALVFTAASGERVEASARESQPGHWPFTVTFPAVGAWRALASVRSENGAEDVALDAIDVHADASSAAKAAAVEPPAGAIGFSFESQWPIGMRFERVTPRAFTDRFTVAGRIEARPGARAHASAPVAGRLLAPTAGRLPRPGDRVAAGDVIARVQSLLTTSDLVAIQALEYQQHQLRHELDLQQLEAERVLGTARVRIQAGTRELERAERLLAGSLGSQVELEAARAALELARAEEHAALSSLDSVHRLRNEHAEDPGVGAPTFDVAAPINGVVASFEAAPGESVDAGELLATILDLETMWAVAEVPEHQIERLARVAMARVRARGGATHVDVGSPVFVAPVVDPLTRCVAVAFLVPNLDGNLRDGMLATFELAHGSREGVPTVPETAIAYEQGRPVVWALHDGETFLKRRVSLGPRDGSRLEILDGLVLGEVIAATHADDLRLAALAGSGQIVEHHH